MRYGNLVTDRLDGGANDLGSRLTRIPLLASLLGTPNADLDMSQLNSLLP
jgi:hypothetical protein